jgi:hypothetical protein
LAYEKVYLVVRSMLVRAAVIINDTKVEGVPIIKDPASTLCSGLLLMKQL